MSDARLRALERRAAVGGPEDQAAHLRARMGAGERSGITCGGCTNCKPWLSNGGWCGGTGYLPLSEGVRLAAYLGDPVSRMVDGWTPGIGDMHPLGSWLTGLESYPGALVRAAVAVGRAALPLWERANYADGPCRQCGSNAPITTAWGCRGCEDASRPLAAIRAAEACIADPSEGNYSRVVASAVPGLPLFCIHLLNAVINSYTNGRHPHTVSGFYAAAIQGSGLTEPQVRTAIHDALVPWALGTLTDHKPTLTPEATYDHQG